MDETTQTTPYGGTFGQTAPEVYERHFVPAIGLPIARDLIDSADLQQGEKVLDVACGTGVVARVAAKKVTPGGTVVGVDVNAGMLDVARSTTPSTTSIQWYEAPAEAMPLPDETFDAVMCGLSLQFFHDKPTALREMRRVLVSDGRLAISVPGRITELFEIMADALARHIDPSLGGFVREVFSLPEPEEIERLLDEAGFTEIKSGTTRKSLQLPEPEQFLWQYINSTPLAQPVAQVGNERREALARDVVPKWQQFVDNGGMTYSQKVVFTKARKS